MDSTVAAATVAAAAVGGGAGEGTGKEQQQGQGQGQGQEEGQKEGDGSFDVLFVGTGVSIGVPNLGHVLQYDAAPAPPEESVEEEEEEEGGSVGGAFDGKPRKCEVCIRAHRDPTSKDRRNNVSIAVLVNGTGQGAKDEGRKCVLVDAGKTMREALARHFPSEGIRSVHSLLLTHDHADATFGMDDLRDLQRKKVLAPIGIQLLDPPIVTYLTEETMRRLKEMFGYMTQEIPYLDEANRVLLRNVPVLDWRIIESNVAATFTTAGVPVRVLPVYHGGTYISLGFEFGKPGEFVYISDCKTVPEATMAYLSSFGPQGIKTLVIDCLAVSPTPHYSHMTLQESLALLDQLEPQRAFLVGMCCDVGGHDEMNARLRAMGYPHVQLAYDGMVLRGMPLR